MSTVQTFLKEFSQEAETTRKMLSIVPTDKYDWKPHPKSMTVSSLATHIAELPGWINMAINTSELDFAANPYKPVAINNDGELMDYFERTWKDGKDLLEKTEDEALAHNWTLRNGDDIYVTSSKAEVIRMTYNQIVHHRAQLGVYLRLLNIPIPGSYGPSADEMGF